MKKQGKKTIEGVVPNHPKFEFGIERRIVGILELPDFTILAKEFWHIMKEHSGELYEKEQQVTIGDITYWNIMIEHPGELYVPDNRLFTDSRFLLEQGKTLASTQTNEAGHFTLEWKDAPTLKAQPWREDVFLVDETYDSVLNLPPVNRYPQVTAYRILTLHCWDNVSSEEATQPVEKSLVPAPMIVFYGSECEKDVGQLK